MRLVLATLPIFVPVLFWAGYHYYKDRHQPEPVLNLVFCFLLGIGASYLAKFMYASLDLIGMRFDPYELAANNLWHMFAYAVLVIGGIEETAKLLPFLTRRSRPALTAAWGRRAQRPAARAANCASVCQPAAASMRVNPKAT